MARQTNQPFVGRIRLVTSTILALFVATSPVRAVDATTVVIRDIDPGSGSSIALDISAPAVYEGRVYFSASDGVHGAELWVSDGTVAGTTMLKDINAGAGSSGVSRLGVGGPYLYFTADDGVNGVELWKTDGTASGTSMVKNIGPGSAGANPDDFADGYVSIGGTTFFTADTSTGRELWKTDGTSSGTVMVKDINTSPFTGSDPFQAKVVGSTLFFTANDGINGTELWKSDGSEAGTELVKDIWPGATNSEPRWLTPFGGAILFAAMTTCGRELWRSDGTEVGTYQVKNIDPAGDCGEGSSSEPIGLISTGSVVFFQASDDTTGKELWKTDGTEVGTVLVKNINPTGDSFAGPEAVLDGVLYFIADDGASGAELWKSDGTSAGTVQVDDLNEGPGSSYPFRIYAFEGEIWYFAAPEAEEVYLYRYAPVADEVEKLALPAETDRVSCECQRNAIIGGNRTVFFPLMSETLGAELGVVFLDGLPSTNRFSSGWPAVLVLLAAVTATAGAVARRRESRSH